MLRIQPGQRWRGCAVTPHQRNWNSTAWMTVVLFGDDLWGPSLGLQMQRPARAQAGWPQLRHAERRTATAGRQLHERCCVEWDLTTDPGQRSYSVQLGRCSRIRRFGTQQRAGRGRGTVGSVAGAAAATWPYAWTDGCHLRKLQQRNSAGQRAVAGALGWDKLCGNGGGSQAGGWEGWLVAAGVQLSQCC